MASGFNEEELSLSFSSGDDGSSYIQDLPGPPSPKYNSSAVSAMEQYDTEEIEYIWDIVLNLSAEKTPRLLNDTLALFEAYEKKNEGNRLDTITDRRITKILFMLGDQRYGTTIIDRFKAVMAKLNIPLEIDGRTMDDGQSDYTNDYEPQIEDEADERSVDTSQASTPPIPDHVLELSAIAFARHSSRFYALSNFHKWQTKSSYILNTVEQINAARDADLRESVHPAFETWNALSAHLGSILPTDLPPNVCLKGMETLACQIHALQAARTFLTRWRRCSRERCHRPHETVKNLVVIDDEEDQRLSKLATRAHDNFAKSRVFTQWSNRVAEEEGKARVAMKAHEMGLKSRAFGMRPKLEELALALRRRSQVDHAVESTVYSALESPRTPLNSVEAAPQANKKEELPIVSPETDELTLVARKHILRMRYFLAWQDSVAENVTKSSEFALKKVLDPWRERASDLDEAVARSSEKHEIHIVKSALCSWADELSQAEEQQRVAREADYKSHIMGVLKPWLAASREKYRGLQGLFYTLQKWTDHTNGVMVLEVESNHVYIRRQLSGTLSKWRVAATAAEANQKQLQRWGNNANYYYRVTNVLRVWKTKARQGTVQKSMKIEALEQWRECGHQVHSHSQQLESYAERADFYYKISAALPIWREATIYATQKQQQLQEYGERADYYYKTRNALLTWRVTAKDRRKAKLKEAHLEVRRRVKKGMGARCITEWRVRLQSSCGRNEQLNMALEEAIGDRKWEAMVQAIDMWRRRAAEKQQLSILRNTAVEQRALEEWRGHAANKREMQMQAQGQWQDRAETKALKGWSLRGLQNESQRHTVMNVVEKKERKLLRQGFEEWYARTTDTLVSTQLPDGAYKTADDLVHDVQQDAEHAKANGLFSTWRTAVVQNKDNDKDYDDGTYAPTPGRPHFLLGELGIRQTMTPLAPIPNRQAWPVGGPGDSILGGSLPAPQGRASRPARSRRGLRVSWAE